MAARDIRALPKLEGTVHVNLALILKFMPNYFFFPAEYSEIPLCDFARNDDFLFNQGPARGLGKIQFHDYNLAYNAYDVPNLALFREQIAVFKDFLAMATPDEAQQKDTDFLLALGELFALVLYGQLILENVKHYGVDNDTLDQILDCLVRDLSKFALQLYSKPSSTPAQMDFCLKMIRKPIVDSARYDRVWRNSVDALKGAYEMNP
jgi:acyl-CoA dehydrogenase